jgi:hypothetical protein
MKPTTHKPSSDHQKDTITLSILREAREIELLKDAEGEEETEDFGLDVEMGDDDLSNIIDGVEEEPVTAPTPEIEPVNNEKMNMVSLDDLKSLLMQILQPANQPVPSPIQTSTTNQTTVAVDAPVGQNLEGGEAALKRAFFQSEGNEILDSEFDFNDPSISNLEGHVNNQNYLDAIGGQPTASGITQEQGNFDVFDPEMDDEPEFQAGMSVLASSDCVESRTDYDMDIIGDGSNAPAGANRLVADLPTSPDFDPEEEEESDMLLDVDGEPEEEKINEEIMDFDPETEGHPDISRIAGTRDFSPMDEEGDTFLPAVDLEPDFEEPVTPAVNMRKNVNLGGQQVQLILTGVMITMPELNYIGESVKASGAKLKKISGSGNNLCIILEANDKHYTINYVDMPRYQAPTPFSIKNYKFGTLEEALKKISEKRQLKEAEIFHKIIGADMQSRQINEFKESDIFEGLNENVKHVSGWNVFPVGFVNLKNCLNETYRDITQHSKEPNTLFMSQNGNYFLIKGNLKERSKVGVKKELVDLKNNKSYGIGEVVGVFENTAAGLGEIMYKTKRTSIPLLVWK